MFLPRLVELSGKVGLKSSQEKPDATSVLSAGFRAPYKGYIDALPVYTLLAMENETEKQADNKIEAAD